MRITVNKTSPPFILYLVDLSITITLSLLLHHFTFNHLPQQTKNKISRSFDVNNELNFTEVTILIEYLLPLCTKNAIIISHIPFALCIFFFFYNKHVHNKGTKEKVFSECLGVK